MIDEMVALSGLSKQDYIITKLLNNDVVVKPNPRVYKALRDKIDEMIGLLNANVSKEGIDSHSLEIIKTIISIYSGLN